MNKRFVGLLALFLCEANAAQSFAGLWFACEGRTGEFQVLNVESVRGQYKGLLESSRNGGVYSAELKGSVRAGTLELRGCQAYRGEPPSTCTPAVAVTLGAAGSPFKRVGGAQLERNIGECRSQREEQ